MTLRREDKLDMKPQHLHITKEETEHLGFPGTPGPIEQ